MEEQNIDKLFKEKLKEFKEVPDEKVWGAIEASLDKKQNKRRIIPIWWRWAGVAALLVLAFLVFNPFASDLPQEVEVTNTETTPQPEEENAGEVTAVPDPETPAQEADDKELPDKDAFGTAVVENEQGQEARDDNPGIANESNVGISAVAANQQTENEVSTKNDESPVEEVIALETQENKEQDPNVFTIKDDAIAISKEDDKAEAITEANKTTVEEEPAVVIAETEQESTPVQDADAEKISIFDAIEEKEEEVAEERTAKWSVGPSVAPVYYDALGSGSPVDPQFTGNSKSGTVSLSYGLSVAYNLNDRWEIRSGIHRVDQGYRTDDIAFTSSFNSGGNSLANIDYVPTSTNLVVQSQGAKIADEAFALTNDVSAQNPSRDGRMVQELGYMEVPLEVSYRILDRKVGLRVLAGMSSLFLLDNNVTLESEGSSMMVGEANNVNSLNFSTNLGLGVSYEATDKLEVNVEPMVKYQLNAFTNVAGNFQPYTLGVYSGIRYKF